MPPSYRRNLLQTNLSHWISKLYRLYCSALWPYIAKSNLPHEGHAHPPPWPLRPYFLPRYIKGILLPALVLNACIGSKLWSAELKNGNVITLGYLAVFLALKVKTFLAQFADSHSLSILTWTKELYSRCTEPFCPKLFGSWVISPLNAIFWQIPSISLQFPRHFHADIGKKGRIKTNLKTQHRQHRWNLCTATPQQQLLVSH